MQTRLKAQTQHLAFRKAALAQNDLNESFLTALALPEATSQQVLAKYKKLVEVCQAQAGLMRTSVIAQFLPLTAFNQFPVLRKECWQNDRLGPLIPATAAI